MSGQETAILRKIEFKKRTCFNFKYNSAETHCSCMSFKNTFVESKFPQVRDNNTKRNTFGARPPKSSQKQVYSTRIVMCRKLLLKPGLHLDSYTEVDSEKNSPVFPKEAVTIVAIFLQNRAPKREEQTVRLQLAYCSERAVRQLLYLSSSERDWNCK